LLEKESLFAASAGAAADFISGVTERGIGIERGLVLAGFCGTNFGVGLAQGWVAVTGEFLGLLQREQRTLRVFLRAAHARELRFERGALDVVMPLLAGRGGDASQVGDGRTLRGQFSRKEGAG
jgi:hypothetical protein